MLADVRLVNFAGQDATKSCKDSTSRTRGPTASRTSSPYLFMFIGVFISSFLHVFCYLGKKLIYLFVSVFRNLFLHVCMYLLLFIYPFLCFGHLFIYLFIWVLGNMCIFCKIMFPRWNLEFCFIMLNSVWPKILGIKLQIRSISVTETSNSDVDVKHPCTHKNINADVLRSRSGFRSRSRFQSLSRPRSS